MTAVCRACQAPIVWAVTLAGELMPLDEKPNERGNVELTGDTGTTPSGGRAPQCRVVDVNQGALFEDHPPERWMPHWATCPHADRFRR